MAIEQGLTREDAVAIALWNSPAAPLIAIATGGTPHTLITDALASRPDVRAAEIGVEAAARRAAWERSRAMNLIGYGLRTTGKALSVLFPKPAA